MAILHDLDTWRIPELLADARVTVAGVGEFDVRACSDDLFAILPAREAPVAAMLRKRLRPGAIFVDAGANIGLFTVLGSRLVGNGGRVFAIEMMPETASRLRRHVDANDLTNVTVFQSALSNRSGDSVRAFVPESKFGQASIVRHGLLGDEWQVTVQTQTLDDLLADTCGTIDLMKMDLEGAEAMALRGAKEMLKRTRAVIFEELPGESRAAELLQECGFTLRPLDPTNRIAERTR